MRSLSIEWVLLLSQVFSYYRMCSLYYSDAEGQALVDGMLEPAVDGHSIRSVLVPVSVAVSVSVAFSLSLSLSQFPSLCLSVSLCLSLSHAKRSFR